MGVLDFYRILLITYNTSETVLGPNRKWCCQQETHLQCYKALSLAIKVSPKFKFCLKCHGDYGRHTWSRGYITVTEAYNWLVKTAALIILAVVNPSTQTPWRHWIRFFNFIIFAYIYDVDEEIKNTNLLFCV